MQDFFLKTPLFIYLISFQIFFSKIWVAKLGVRLICECGLYAGVYGTPFKSNASLKPYENIFYTQ